MIFTKCMQSGPGLIWALFFGDTKNVSKTFQKIPKKNMQVPEHGTHHRVEFRTETISYTLCRKWTNFLSEIQIFRSQIWHEICRFSTERIQYRFGAKFDMVVCSMFRYVHIFFRNFLKSFETFFCVTKKRAHMSSGSKEVFRKNKSYLVLV
jgi:hypothetical protein